MKFIFSKLKLISNKKEDRLKFGLNLFKSKKKGIKSNKTSKKNKSERQSKVSDLERILSSSSQRKKAESKTLLNLSIQKGVQAPPMGIQVINDFFNRPLTSNEQQL